MMLALSDFIYLSRLYMPKSNTQRVTLDDVARLANVSSQTVSRVVNNYPHVSEETRRRVQDAIQLLGYRPNRAARSLVTQRSFMLGIISFGFDHYGPTQMINNIERTARAKGYGVSFSNVDTASVGALQRAMEDLGERAVDGIVLILPIEGIEYSALQDVCCNTPFVQIDAPLAAKVPSIVIDQYHGSQLATEHLIARGHRQICEISGPLSWHGAQARHQSWLDTLQLAGLEPGLSIEGDWSARSGYQAVHELIAAQAAFTALVVGNDQMALGAMRALREHGLHIPQDVSIVGFDDIPEAAYFEPPLTTINQNFAALGDQSVEYLTALIEDPGIPPHQRVLYPHLVERASTRSVT